MNSVKILTVPNNTYMSYSIVLIDNDILPVNHWLHREPHKAKLGGEHVHVQEWELTQASMVGERLLCFSLASTMMAIITRIQIQRSSIIILRGISRILNDLKLFLVILKHPQTVKSICSNLDPWKFN